MRTFVKQLALVVLFLWLHSVLVTAAVTTDKQPIPDDVNAKGAVIQIQGNFQMEGVRWVKGDPVFSGVERVLPLNLLLPLLGLTLTLYFS